MEIGDHNFVNNGENDFTRELRLVHLAETFSSFRIGTPHTDVDTILGGSDDYFEYKREPIVNELFINPNYILI
jgi:hypothetical protein